MEIGNLEKIDTLKQSLQLEDISEIASGISVVMG